MSNKKPAHPNGTIRQSQLITTFGPGALVDLTEYSVLIGGLDVWGNPETTSGFHPIYEERLIAKLNESLGVSGLKLYAPPIDSPDPSAPKTGITAFQFPEWFIVQEPTINKEGVRSRPLVHFKGLTKGKYQDGKKKHSVVPIRFVQACINGHISDIRWGEFVHGVHG